MAEEHGFDVRTEKDTDTGKWHWFIGDNGTGLTDVWASSQLGGEEGFSTQKEAYLDCFAWMQSDEFWVDWEEEKV